MREVKIDVLIVQYSTKEEDKKYWIKICFKRWNLNPTTIVICQPPTDLVLHEEKTHRLLLKNLASYGYNCVDWIVDATQYGAAVHQTVLITIAHIRHSPTAQPPLQKVQGFRSMKNFLLPQPFIHTLKYTCTTLQENQRRLYGNHIGYAKHGYVVTSDEVPMVLDRPSYVLTQGFTRQIDAKELYHDVGWPKKWEYLPRQQTYRIRKCVSAHIWSILLREIIKLYSRAWVNPNQESKQRTTTSVGLDQKLIQEETWKYVPPPKDIGRI